MKGLGVGGFTPRAPPEGQLIITTTRSHSSPLVQEALDALKPDTVLRVGGAGHKVNINVCNNSEADISDIAC